MKWIQKHWFLLSILFISIIRYLLTYNIPSFYITNLIHDDALMIKQMRSLLIGQYLGKYNETTLIKGVIFPLVLFYAKTLHLTFSSFFSILYIFASVYFVNSLKSIIKNKHYLILIFILILLNPVTYSIELFQRLYNNTIVITEILFFFGIVIKILSEEEWNKIHFIFLGFISSMMFLTRNDFIWVYIILIIVVLFKWNKKELLTILLPFITIFVIFNIFSAVNYVHYGVYTYNEVEHSNFTKAYHNLLKIKKEETIEKVNIPKSTLYKLSEVSDTFHYTKEEINQYYKKIGFEENEEVDNGNIIWVLRKMIYSKENFQSGKEANEYFKQLNEDIKKAFKEKKLEKEGETISIFMNPSSLKNIIKNLPKSIINTVIYTTTYKNVRTVSKESMEQKKGVSLVHSHVNTYGAYYEDYRYAENIFTTNNLFCEIIRQIYKYGTLILSIFSLFIWIKNRQKKDKLNQIIFLVLLTYIMILLGVAYTDATAFHAIRYRYLAGVYILQNIFILLNLYRFLENKKERVLEERKTTLVKEGKMMNPISIIIPAYNEEKVIGETIEEIKKVLKKNKMTKYEIIVVNDGSTDKTREEALSKKVIVLDNPENMGYGYSLKKGIRKAKNEWIVITDADKTYPFDGIGEMLSEKARGYDLVVGARNGKYYKESIHKMILRKLLKRLVEFVTEKKVRDINSGLRVFDKSTVVKFFPRLCNTFSFTTSQTLAYMMNSLSVGYVDINYKKRIGKSKVHLVRDSLKSLRYIMEACIYYNPIKMFSLLSIICILLSIIGFIFSHFVGIHAGYILGIGGLLLSIVIFSIGLLAVLLKQIMDK